MEVLRTEGARRRATVVGRLKTWGAVALVAGGMTAVYFVGVHMVHRHFAEERRLWEQQWNKENPELAALSKATPATNSVALRK
jgi:hypothetical protein